MSLRLMTQIWDMQTGLTPTEKAVLIKLADNASDDGENCWPSQETIARQVEISIRTVIRAIQKLELLGFIKVKRAMNGDGKREVNRYKINVTKLSKNHVTDCPSPCDTHDQNHVPPVSHKPPIEPSDKKVYKKDSENAENLKTDKKLTALFMIMRMVEARYGMNVDMDFTWQNKTRAAVEKLFASNITLDRIEPVLEWLSNPENEFEFTVDSGGRFAGNFISIEQKMKVPNPNASIEWMEKTAIENEKKSTVTRKYVDEYEQLHGAGSWNGLQTIVETQPDQGILNPKGNENNV